MGPTGITNEARLRIDGDSNPQIGSPIITPLNGGTPTNSTTATAPMNVERTAMKTPRNN
jgi:hypothetical protein